MGASKQQLELLKRCGFREDARTFMDRSWNLSMISAVVITDREAGQVGTAEALEELIVAKIIALQDSLAAHFAETLERIRDGRSVTLQPQATTTA